MQAAKGAYSLLPIAGPLSSPTAALAEDYVDKSRTVIEPESKRERFEFALAKEDRYPHLELTIQMSQGPA